MTIAEGFMRDQVYIDFGTEIMYGDDQAYIDYPSRFPTVEFQLMATEGLAQIADRIRVDLGFAPMHPTDDYTDDTCDNNGWYDFYAGLNGFAQNHMDNCITFTVVNSDSPDNEDMYQIDLSPDEQTALYERLNEQCQDYLGQTCEELLEEARKRMEDAAAENDDFSSEREDTI